MVLRRTVRRRRRWSEALARGGPSSPLPSTGKKRSRHSRPGPATLVYPDRIDPPVVQEPVEPRDIFSDGHHLPLVVPQLTSEHFENLP